MSEASVKPKGRSRNKRTTSEVLLQKVKKALLQDLKNPECFPRFGKEKKEFYVTPAGRWSLKNKKGSEVAKVWEELGYGVFPEGLQADIQDHLMTQALQILVEEGLVNKALPRKGYISTYSIAGESTPLMTPEEDGLKQVKEKMTCVLNNEGVDGFFKKVDLEIDFEGKVTPVKVDLLGTHGEYVIGRDANGRFVWGYQSDAPCAFHTLAKAGDGKESESSLRNLATEILESDEFSTIIKRQLQSTPKQNPVRKGKGK